MSSGGFTPVSGPGSSRGEYGRMPDLTLQTSPRSSSHASSSFYSTAAPSGRAYDQIFPSQGSMTYHSASAPPSSSAGPPGLVSPYQSGSSIYGPQYERSNPASIPSHGTYPGAFSHAGPQQNGRGIRPPFILGGSADPGRYPEPPSPDYDSPIREQEVVDTSLFPDNRSNLGTSQAGKMKGHMRTESQRRLSSRDEFDGHNQMLDMPSAEVIAARDRDLPRLPMNLYVEEQDNLLSQVNNRLSQCAFDFVARYQFPIPIESDKRSVRAPNDREWTEWCFLLKRLATKRRIPARILYNGQIKQLVTVLENSMEMRHAAAHQSRPPKDDRNVLQLISAGIQVTKLLKDAAAMEFLDGLYVHTEKLIQSRRTVGGFST
ncbi:MAG: hypothetical protein M4579_003786 [Chaenotheca gracillima]|nr:MAG: hypothetical protein M4579_003786 [Chaenotheca gracillima]